MNNKELTYILNNPTALTNHNALDNIIEEFPYFQSVRAIQLKHLRNTNSYKYNQALKKTAAYTIDRGILFEIITSPIFINKELKKTDINTSENAEKTHPKNTQNTLEKSSQLPKKEKLKKEHPKDILELGKPIQFSKSEPHSFTEWMQLISSKPIVREEKEEVLEKKITKPDDKFELIDKFIKANPKIVPADKTQANNNITLYNCEENESLMTETLAKVYLEQKKYDNAIKAYHILSLKYPEKSSFFADRIKAIKILQRNKI